MKRYLLSLTALFVTLTIVAQPSWVKKATKAVFTLKTFTADGTLLASSTGFFVAADGVAVSSYAPFRGASRAVIIDAAGKELPVVSMLGANETYDVAKFRVDVKKTQVLTLSVAQPGQQVYTNDSSDIVSLLSLVVENPGNTSMACAEILQPTLTNADIVWSK